jgi:maltose/moltooligosaccharide transporter
LEQIAMAANYQVGSLTYSKLGLLSLCLWLLGGDFFFTLMEIVLPSILPLKLKSLAAPNLAISLIMSTIPSVMNVAINPIVSLRSDRYRSRLGRRIPFLLFATPFVTLFLVLMAFSESIGRSLHGLVSPLAPTLSGNTVILTLIGVLMVCFQFFNMFVSSIYYYLFNDVVPRQMIARFLAAFRAISILSVAAYNMFIFQFAESHMREILIWSALLFCVVFIMMCFKVKEGEYPPPPEQPNRATSVTGSVMGYFRENFRYRFYVYLFLSNAMWVVVNCMAPFNIFFIKSLGLTLAQWGKINAYIQFFTAIFLYPVGMLADRFHPLRTIRIAIICNMLISPLLLLFVFYDPPARLSYVLIIGYYCLSLPITTAYAASQLPNYMALLPKEKFGQIASADTIIRSAAMIAGGLFAGVYLDGMKLLSQRMGYPDAFYYRAIPLWNFAFLAASAFFMNLVYRQWQRMGGIRGYVPPGSESS